jgi:CDP-diacylglycerol--glycerol-3-phosphate 3-phosphatidyltransferase
MKKYIPDLLAWFRIFSSPVILFLILQDGSQNGLMLTPAILAFIAAWTDFFDGKLARKWDVSTKTGAFLDTIADKLFVTCIFIGFTYIDRVNIWITVLLISREFIVTGLRGLAGNEGKLIPPSPLGKIKASPAVLGNRFCTNGLSSRHNGCEFGHRSCVSSTAFFIHLGLSIFRCL